MPEPTLCKNHRLDLLSFLGISGIALFSYLLLYRLSGPVLILTFAGFLLIQVILYRRLYSCRPLLRHSITFFLILYAAYPVLYYQGTMTGLGFPGALGVLPFLSCFGISVLHRKKLPLPSCLGHHRKDRLCAYLLPIMVLFTAISLVLWVKLLKPDLSVFFNMIPDVSLPALLGLGILFALSNAFVEEMLFRGFLFDGLWAVDIRPWMIIVTQAILFGLWHYKGFPGGVVGALMVFVWALLLGYMRHRSGRIWYPYIGHVLADLTIFGILMVLYPGAVAV